MIENPRSPLLHAIGERFLAEFGGEPPRMFFAPGRINLVGAHLDYSGGDVLPMAVDRGIYAAARLRSDGRIRLVSLDQKLVVELESKDVGMRTRPELGWGGYPLGVWHGFQQRTGTTNGFEMVIGADLPMASGLSSSAAIEVVTAIALDALLGTRLERQQIALLAHRAETGFVGVRCGIMDQFASALGRPGHVLLVHCAGPRWEHVPFDPKACEVLVMDTRKPRSLSKTGFNERVAQCATAHELLRMHARDLPHLAMYSMADLEQASEAMDEVLFLRARHVITEMDRIRTGAAALRRHDYRELGRQLDASHRSTATDYAVSCDELDVITDAARSHEAVFGARLTGAGFGGCAIALVKPGASSAVARVVAEQFTARFGVVPGFDLLRVGTGPGEIAR
ncbi:MAG: galactokinase [Planctomycetes bacterium]|jgi:galactokinase|nr:galactokinase [Planctomycetota bacterium]MCC7063679.1 galactokinase [Planctomycetota bacterium]